MDDRYIFIYGKHAVLEALTTRPDVVTTLYLRDDVIAEVSLSLRNAVAACTQFRGDNVPRGVDSHAVHQGYIAQIDQTKLLIPYDEWRAQLSVTNDTALVVLGEVHDPHNVGAVIRSAAGFGLAAVLIPKHRQVGVTGTVVKVSAGMAFRIPLVAVPNVNRALEDLKRAGFFTYALEGTGDTSLVSEQFTKPSVFVLGNEGEGVREKTLEHCDFHLKIPLHPQCESLNVSNAAAVTFYAWSAQHPYRDH